MKIIQTVSEMQNWSDLKRRAGSTIAVVPTMGFLHEGHLSLVDAARNAGADTVVVTIFVNPTQFGPNEDFEKYPRDFEHDRSLLEAKKVDAIFAPSASEMYPSDASTWVEETKLSKGLCGITRPIHFRGVATVVTKLFNAVLPQIAVFGQKDAQQARVIKRMVRDLNVPVRIVIAPIVREPDGLAKSSRNKYLSPEDRSAALSLSKGLFALKEKIESGNTDLDLLIADLISSIETAGGRVDYAESVDSETLEPVTVLKKGQEILFPLAAYFGSTRLIDNILVRIP